ncbi:hypothetical protein CHY08_22090 [Rhizobium leguminosarum bv. viciae]|nr:hypothetical protein CHY08_22090 [Rhizobium leguminosarum bv. viciae]
MPRERADRSRCQSIHCHGSPRTGGRRRTLRRSRPRHLFPSAGNGHKTDVLNCLTAIHKPDLGPDEETEWVAGVNILTGEEVYIPFEAVVLDRTRDARYWMSSDGLASGNNVEEAILHGVLERIERDAHVLWQVGAEADRYAGCTDPRGFEDGALDGLIDKIETSGLALRLFDITSDIGIPCFTAMLGPGDSLLGPRDFHGNRTFASSR